MSLKKCPECDGNKYITTACIEVKILANGQIIRCLDEDVTFSAIDQNASCQCSECGYEAPLRELMD